jgi:8-oxo-dGTP pyrophosphatase MutT (NUDIX family)
VTEGTFLGSLCPRLARDQPARLVPRESAGVAVIFQDRADEEHVLLIRRAEREGDPWSGQVAFPGGMVSATDKSFEETARREAAEEVGVELSPGSARFLGYMKELKARTREVVVVPSVFKLTATASLTPNREVAAYEWVALRSLARREARSTYLLRREGVETPFPSFVHGGLVIWGLTERILYAIIRGRAEPGDDGVLGEIQRY